MDVEEEVGEAPREICKEAFWHRTEQPLDIVREVLVMVFLDNCQHKTTRPSENTDFIPQCTQQILDGLAVIFSELA